MLSIKCSECIEIVARTNVMHDQSPDTSSNMCCGMMGMRNLVQELAFKSGIRKLFSYNKIFSRKSDYFVEIVKVKSTG